MSHTTPGPFLVGILAVQKRYTSALTPAYQLQPECSCSRFLHTFCFLSTHFQAFQPTSLVARGRASATLPNVIRLCQLSVSNLQMEMLYQSNHQHRASASWDSRSKIINRQRRHINCKLHYRSCEASSRDRHSCLAEASDGHNKRERDLTSCTGTIRSAISCTTSD